MVTIKNYRMPHNCYDCDLQNYHECDLTGESIEEDYCWNGNSREKHCSLREVEAIPKADYEARLKADMVAMLTEIKDAASNICSTIWNCDSFTEGIRAYDKLIQQKIKLLKENNDEIGKSNK